MANVTKVKLRFLTQTGTRKRVSWTPHGRLMGGRPATLWVYLVPLWESAGMPWPCVQTAVLFANKNFIALPNRWCGDILGPWAILGHIFVFLRNLYCGGYFGRQALRTNKQTKTNKKQNKKTSWKSNFLLGGLAHGREIFSYEAAFVAAHFPPRVVWRPNPTNGVISPKRPTPCPLSEK